jgi:hypothetical protein
MADSRWTVANDKPPTIGYSPSAISHQPFAINHLQEEVPIVIQPP